MKEAGAHVLAGLYDLVPSGLAEIVAAEVFAAMVACQSEPCENRPTSCEAS